MDLFFKAAPQLLQDLLVLGFCHNEGYGTMPANTMVVGAGNYKFMDYVKSGLPLIIIALIVSMIVLPIAFPFYP